MVQEQELQSETKIFDKRFAGPADSESVLPGVAVVAGIFLVPLVLFCFQDLPLIPKSNKINGSLYEFTMVNESSEDQQHVSSHCTEQRDQYNFCSHG